MIDNVTWHNYAKGLFRRSGVRVTRLYALRGGCVIYLYQMSNTTARSMDSSILNMLPENRFKRPLMLITETLGLWKLMWCGIEVDVLYWVCFLWPLRNIIYRFSQAEKRSPPFCFVCLFVFVFFLFFCYFLLAAINVWKYSHSSR